jgi:hypothetical protein
MKWWKQSRHLALGSVVMGLLLTASVSAQSEQTGEMPKKPVEDDHSKFKTLIGSNGNLLTGAEGYEESKHLEAMVALAKYHTYRYTWSENRQPGTVKPLLDSLDADLSKMVKNKPKTANAIEGFAKQVSLLADAMFNNREPLARVNYVRVLLRFAQEGTEEVFDPLTKALTDPNQLDGVKYWACLALKEILWRQHQVPAQTFRDKNNQRQIAAITGLIALIERKPPETVAVMPEDEREGLRVLRREAVKALALSRFPAVENDKKQFLPTAQLLARIISSDGFVIPTQIDEQVEATIGLCRMQSGLYANYQPEAAAWFIGKGIAAFATRYVNAENGGERGWKVNAARLNEALAVLDVDISKNKTLTPTAMTFIKKVIKDGGDLTKKIETKGSVTPRDFNIFLGAEQPQPQEIYKGRADSVVKPPPEN